MSDDGVPAPDAARARAAFDQLLAEMRPRLHRYCARMTGSVVDGEDVLQEAIVKAIEGYPSAGPIANPEGGSFASRTMRRSTFCAGGLDSRQPIPIMM